MYDRHFQNTWTPLTSYGTIIALKFGGKAKRVLNLNLEPATYCHIYILE